MVRQVGAGAMGAVYEAEHLQLRRRVAIKVLRPEVRDNATARARFAREGRVAARLDHPSVIEVIDAGTCDAGPYLVMEYVDGPTLAEHLRSQGALSLKDALEIVLPLVSALMHAHREGIVHRDVKPANVLLTRDRLGDVVAKIGDFGIGKSLNESSDRSLTKDGLVGSLPYMAPEQVREAKTVDARADQYSLAVLAYETLANRLPFEETLSFELMEAICAGRRLPLSRTAAGLPAPVTAAIDRAMSLDPNDRYPTVAAFGRELVRFSSGRSWALWSRDFEGEGATPPGGTLGDVPVRATSADSSAGLRRLAPHGRLRILLPLAWAGLGALATASALRAWPAPAPNHGGGPAVGAQPEPPREIGAMLATEPPPPVDRIVSVAIDAEPPAVHPAAAMHSARPAAPPVQTRAPTRAAPTSSAAPQNPRDLGKNNAPILD